MKMISLFAGIGGFDLGFSRCGFDVVAHVEIDANCRKLLKSYWPGAISHDDVRSAGKSNLPPCDLITFGFPCQDLSIAGKRVGIAGSRSSLFAEALRIADELNCPWILFENVPGLLMNRESQNEGDEDFGGRDNGDSGSSGPIQPSWMGTLLAAVGKRGYAGAWRVLDAQWFGLAQRRRRVFGLFTRHDIGAKACAEILSITESLQGNPQARGQSKQAFAGTASPGIGNGCRQNIVGTLDTQCGSGKLTHQSIVNNHIIGTITSRMFNALGARDVEEGALVPVSVDIRNHTVSNVCHTISSRNDMQAGAVFDSNAWGVRRLTPLECERLQGFPDHWTGAFSDSIRYKMLGNAVAVPCAEWIARRMMRRFAH